MLNKPDVIKTIKDATRGLERKRSLTIQQAALIGRLRKTLETVTALPVWKVQKLKEKKKKQAAGTQLTDLFNPAVRVDAEPEIVINEVKKKRKKKTKTAAQLLEKANDDYIASRIAEDLPSRRRRRRISNQSVSETLGEVLQNLSDQLNRDRT